jgi:hypothetical protein
MNAQVVLTPAESKRLIARGVAAAPFVKRALAHGVVAIAKGTTNAYVVEEILGRPIDKQRYVTGLRLPAKSDMSWVPQGRLDDVVLKQGQVVPGAVVTEYITQMSRGDVFIKGANILDISRKEAGIYLGHNTGGTIGATWGTITARGIRLVIPVGLEKLSSSPVSRLARLMAAAEYEQGERVGLMPVTGEIITEIEALQFLYGVNAVQMGAGGVGGAEGSVHLLLEGEKAAIAAALAGIDEIQGEKPFAQLGAQ